MKCFNCGSEVDIRSRRCPNCGMIQPGVAIPHANIPRAASVRTPVGNISAGEVGRMVSRSKMPVWVWIIIGAVILLIAVCACAGVGYYLYTSGTIKIPGLT